VLSTINSIGSSTRFSTTNFFEKISRFPPAAYQILDLPDCDSDILQIERKNTKDLLRSCFLAARAPLVALVAPQTTTGTVAEGS
jgi:hypothetical protein